MRPAKGGQRRSYKNMARSHGFKRDTRCRGLTRDSENSSIAVIDSHRPKVGNTTLDTWILIRLMLTTLVFMSKFCFDVISVCVGNKSFKLGVCLYHYMLKRFTRTENLSSPFGWW